MPANQGELVDATAQQATCPAAPSKTQSPFNKLNWHMCTRKVNAKPAPTSAYIKRNKLNWKQQKHGWMVHTLCLERKTEKLEPCLILPAVNVTCKAMQSCWQQKWFYAALGKQRLSLKETFETVHRRCSHEKNSGQQRCTCYSCNRIH